MNHPDRISFPCREGETEWSKVKTVSQTWVKSSIKNLAKEAGFDESKYSGHSLRAGGATDFFRDQSPSLSNQEDGKMEE